MATFAIPVDAYSTMYVAAAAVYDLRPPTIKLSDVAKSFNLRLKGGKLGYSGGVKLTSDVSAMRPGVDFSNMVVPDGYLPNIAADMDALPRPEQAQAFVDLVASKAIETKRPRGVNEMFAARWVMAKHLAVEDRHAASVNDVVFDSGVKAVYKVASAIANIKWHSKSVSSRRDRAMKVAYARALATTSHVDADAAEEAFRVAERVTAQAGLAGLKTVANAIKAMKLAPGKASFWRRSVEESITSYEGVEKSSAKTAIVEWAKECRAHARRFGSIEIVPIGRWIYVSMLGSPPVLLGEEDGTKLYKVLKMGYNVMRAIASDCTTKSEMEFMEPSEVMRTAYAMYRDILSYGANDVLPLGDEVRACKAFKTVYSVYLSDLCGPFAAKEAASLMEDAEAYPGFRRIAIRWRRRLATLSAASGQSIAKLFRVCPLPDAAAGMTLIERFAKVLVPNKMDPTIEAEYEKAVTAELVRAYVIHSKSPLPLKTGVARPSWYGAYLGGVREGILASEMADCLAWEGAASTELQEPDIYDANTWKDSSLGYDTVKEAFDPERDRDRSNMFLYFLYKLRSADDVKLSQATACHGTFPKPESHKDPARIVYMANLLTRLWFSKFETALGQVGKAHPCFMIGVGPDTFHQRMEGMTITPSAGTFSFYFNFDVDGWSPSMPRRLQDITRAAAGKLLGVSDFASKSAELMFGVPVYMSLFGYKGFYKNPEANMEGYDGKLMTFTNITAMSMSIQEWRRRLVAANMVTQKEASKMAAKLIAYIDDGTARIDLDRSDPAKAVAMVEMLKTAAADTYKRLGLSISLTKSFPSDRLWIFLNEVTISGRQIVHGSKAILRLESEELADHMTIPERLGLIHATVRGASVAGLPARAIMSILTEYVVEEMRTWHIVGSPAQRVAWMFAPEPGLALPSLMQLNTIGGGARDVEAMSNLRFLADTSPEAWSLYLAIVRGVHRPKAPILKLRNGATHGGGVWPRITHSVLPSLVLSAIKARRSKLGAVARKMLSDAELVDVDELAEFLVPASYCAVTARAMLDAAFDATTIADLDSFLAKIQHSKTVKRIVPRAKFVRIWRDSRTQVQAAMQWVARNT